MLFENLLAGALFHYLSWRARRHAKAHADYMAARGTDWRVDVAIAYEKRAKASANLINLLY